MKTAGHEVARAQRSTARGGIITFALFAFAIAGTVAIPIHARALRAARARDTAAIREVAPRLPAGDLALSGGARWLRFPSQEEPNAAFADGPAVPDPDPAGGSMAPPRALYFPGSAP